MIYSSHELHLEVQVPSTQSSQVLSSLVLVPHLGRKPQAKAGSVIYSDAAGNPQSSVSVPLQRQASVSSLRDPPLQKDQHPASTASGPDDLRFEAGSSFRFDCGGVTMPSSSDSSASSRFFTSSRSAGA